MFPSRVFAFAAASLAASFLFGCAAEPSSEDNAVYGEDELTVRPGGTNDRATVTINAPSWFTFNETPIELGKPTLVTPAKNEGNWVCLSITLEARPGGTSTSRECIWQVPARSTNVIELGIAKLWWSGYPQVRSDVFSLAEGYRGALERTYGGARYRQYDALNTNLRQYGLLAQNDVPLLLVPGDYEFTVNNPNYPAKKIRVEAGKQIDVNTDNDAFLAPLELPYEGKDGFIDAYVNNATVTCKNIYGVDRIMGRGTRMEKQLVLLDRSSVDCTMITASNHTFPVKLEAGKTTRIPMKRLNVEDVTLTDEGNRTVRGTYTIVALEGGANGRSWARSTNTGVDLPPSKYAVDVSYTSGTGPRTLRYEVDLR
jgi:hypothetical protein